MRGQEALGGAADQRRIHHIVPSENPAKRTRADQAEAVTADRAPHIHQAEAVTADRAAHAGAKAARPFGPGPRPESTEPPFSPAPAADPRQAEVAEDGISVHVHIDTAGRRDHSGDITAEELSAMFWTVSSSEVVIIISCL